MATTLTPDQLKRLVEILHPWFLGREQEALIAALEKTITYLGSWYDDDIDNIYQTLGLLQGPTGAEMIGITDLGGYFTGTDVEAALQELATAIAGLPPIPTVPTGDGFRRIIAGVEQPAASFPTKGEVGLGNVDNTSDANKPVSTAQAAADAAVQSAAAADATAKANAAQAFAIQRGNHTGTQAQSTVTNLVSDLAGKLSTSGKAADSELLDGVDSTRVAYGANAAATGQVTDMNTPVKSGFYERVPGGGVGNSADGADNWNWFLHVEHTGLNGYGFQLSNIIDTNDFYIRTKDAGVYHAWNKFWHNGNLLNPASLNGGTFTGAVTLPNTGLFFGSSTGQHINLYASNFGIGIQNSTQYFRTGSGAGFAWFVGGVHTATQNDPGTGGTVAATLDASGNYRAVTMGVFTSSNSYFTGNGAGTQHNGDLYLANTNWQLAANSAAWIRVPRTFVQSGDPGAQASDGDIWAW